MLTKVLFIILGYRKCLATPPPGYRNSPTTPSPPPLPPRGSNVGPPVPPSSSTKNETRTVKEFPKGQQLNSKVRLLKVIWSTNWEIFLVKQSNSIFDLDYSINADLFQFIKKFLTQLKNVYTFMWNKFINELM